MCDGAADLLVCVIFAIAHIAATTMHVHGRTVFWKEESCYEESLAASTPRSTTSAAATAVARCFLIGQTLFAQELQRSRNTLEELLFTCEAIVVHHCANHTHRGARVDRTWLVAAGVCRLERLDKVLVTPSGKRSWLLQLEREIECLADGLQKVFAAQLLITLDEELDIGGHHIVVEGDERRIVLLATERMAVHERITLGPTAVGVLADEHEVNHLVERLAHLGIFLFKIDTQQERCTLGSSLIVECAVAVIVLEFLQTPGLSADSGIELLEFVFTCQILDVVPASFGMLHLHNDLGNLAGLLIIIFVARGMQGIDHQMTH